MPTRLRLNGDGSLELFKKTLPSAASLLQVQILSKEARRQALIVPSGARAMGVGRDAHLDLLEMTLRGNKMGSGEIQELNQEVACFTKHIEQFTSMDEAPDCVADYVNHAAALFATFEDREKQFVAKKASVAQKEGQNMKYFNQLMKVKALLLKQFALVQSATTAHALAKSNPGIT